MLIGRAAQRSRAYNAAFCKIKMTVIAACEQRFVPLALQRRYFALYVVPYPNGLSSAAPIQLDLFNEVLNRQGCAKLANLLTGEG
jgi:hypothetical protein